MKSPFEERGDVPFQCPVCGATLAADAKLPVLDTPCSECGYILWCRKRMVDEVVVLDVLPKITLEHADIEPLVRSLVRSGGPPHVVVDLSRIDLISSLLVAKLVVLNKQVKRAKGRLSLCGLREVVREVFASTKLDTIIEVLDDEEAALASL